MIQKKSLKEAIKNPEIISVVGGLIGEGTYNKSGLMPVNIAHVKLSKSDGRYGKVVFDIRDTGFTWNVFLSITRTAPYNSIYHLFLANWFTTKIAIKQISSTGASLPPLKYRIINTNLELYFVESGFFKAEFILLDGYQVLSSDTISMLDLPSDLTDLTLS